MTEPSPFFRQHHAIEAPAIDGAEFRPYWRVWTRLDQLLADRAINATTWRAGVDFRRIAELVLSDQWKTPNFEHVGGGGGENSVPRRLDALKRKAHIRAALGSFAVDLLELHLVGDLPWMQLGEHYGVDRRTARSWTIIALEALPYVMWQRGE